MNKKTKTYVKTLRQTMTPQEQLLWRLLRNRHFSNYKFRRQHPVGPFIVDFACLRPKVIIELDGGQHSESHRYDESRTLWLELRGWRVLRFWNNEFTHNTDDVLTLILDTLAAVSVSQA
ncbi:endonuclease domain-containing protein [Buttiauxella sp.]|uniref:endonuclease domain-containing protein n=1 Tax=Buttiauxella sp. TaxID=1972222 RepID=UPI003C74C22E